MNIRKAGMQVLFACQLFAFYSTHAAPRWPLPPIPECVLPLHSETFDENFSYGETATQLTVGSYVLNESWSGYALQRAGTVVPFIIPGMDSTGHTNISCHNAGAIRFWFKPNWSSASIAGGTGPGAIAQLVELDAVVSKQSAVDWSLQISADGNTLALLDPNRNALLQTPLGWIEGQPHLITLDYNPKGTALFVDSELAAQGAAVAELPPKLAVLVLGSSLTGENPAQGDLDEFYSFPKSLTAMDVEFCYNFNSGNVALGPVSAGDALARQKLVAARKVRRAVMPSMSMMSASMSSSLPMGATSGLLSFGCACNCNCATGGQVYFTNLTATLTTNQGMVVSFNLAGGTNGMAYGVFTTTNIGSPNWKWIGNAYTCSTVYLTNQPADVAFYALGAVSQTMTIAWGNDSNGQSDAPVEITDAIAAAGGDSYAGDLGFSVVLRANGKVIAWGDNTYGQTNVPAGLHGVIVIASGTHHTLALGTDGTVTNWGSWWSSDTNGATIYPTATIPSGLTNIIAIAAGGDHDLAVRCDGSVKAWGYDTNNSYIVVPTNLPPALDVAAGWGHSVALLTNGTVRAWGDDTFGQTDVPSNLSNVVAIATGTFHTLALKSDGTVTAWGAEADKGILIFGFFLNQYEGQSTVPAGLSNVVAIAAGIYYSIALKSDGTVVMWGNGLSLPSYSFSPVTSIGSGWYHALAIRSRPLTPIIVTQPTNQSVVLGSNATFRVKTLPLAGMTYQWQTNAVNIPGATNAALTLSNVQSSAEGSYRVIVAAPDGSLASSNALLEVVTPPLITSFTQPTNFTVVFQSNVTLRVTAAAPYQNSGFPLTYRWLYNSAIISSATSSNYTFSAESSGTYSIIASNAAGTASVAWQVTMTYVGSYIDVGTLAYHLSTNTAPHTNGVSDIGAALVELSGWSYVIFTNANLALLTNAVWSTNFWPKGVQGLSASSIGLTNALGGQGTVTMISPRHCLYANHVHLPPGRFMAAFLDTNNVIYWRTNMENVFVGNDTSLGILDADLPSSVGFLPIVPTNLADYLPANGTAIFQGLGRNQGKRLFSQPMSFTTNSVTWNSSYKVPFGLTINWNAGLTSGDSSNPDMLLIGTQLILISHNWHVPDGPNYAFQIDTINQQMHYLSTNNSIGTDYQLTQFSLTNWPTIH